MGKLLQSVFFKLLLFSVTITAALIICLYYFLYIPSQERLMRDGLFDRVKTIFALSGDVFEGAIKARDDITILSRVESIMKVEDVNSVYILDNCLKVLTHNRIAEWGKTYGDETAKRSVEAKKFLRQRAPGGYLFSMPLTSSSTLCVGISSQKLGESVSSMRKNALLAGAIILIAAAAAFYWCIYSLVYPGFRELRDGLISLELGGGAGRLSDDALRGEFGELKKLVNGVLEKAGSGGQAGQDGNDEETLQDITGMLAKMQKGGLAVIDGENKIIAINQKAGEFLGVPGQDAVGRHILDVIKNSSLLSLLKASAEKPGETFEALAEGNAVKACAARGRSSKISGTILFFQ